VIDSRLDDVAGSRSERLRLLHRRFAGHRRELHAQWVDRRAAVRRGFYPAMTSLVVSWAG